MTEVARQYAIARKLCGGEMIVDAIQTAYERLNVEQEETPALPKWDEAERTLSFRGVVLKRYSRHPAPNQVRVLSAFEEEGWPSTIDSPVLNIRETLHSLNKAIGDGPIRFHSTGTGERIRWVEVK